MKKIQLQNTLSAAVGAAMLAYFALLTEIIYQAHEPSIWSDLWRDAWQPPDGILADCGVFSFWFLFLASVVILWQHVASIGSPDTLRSKLWRVVVVLLIAAFTAFGVVQIAYNSDIGETVPSNGAQGVVTFSVIYLLSLLLLYRMSSAIRALASPALTISHRAFIAVIILVFLFSLVWSVFGSVASGRLYVDCRYHWPHDSD
jgi:hypothetical protein